MIRIVAPIEAKTARLPFYLALEEWVAKTLPGAEYFFTWVVRPTVIFGRNQCVRQEVDLDYCREHGIEVYRRRSGGGCVYADTDNLMISYITPRTDVAATFAGYTGRIARILRDMGLDARPSGRNDVLIGDRKVSGNAFYRLPDRSVVHGTLLLHASSAHMKHAITPARSKLESNRVKSVEARITTIGEYMPQMTMPLLQRTIEDALSTGSFTLSPAQIAQVREIEEYYYKLDWIFGRRGVLGSPARQVHRSARFPGVGSLNATVTLDRGLISDVELTGDYFLLSDLDTCIFDKIRGIPLEPQALHNALEHTDVAETIASLSTGKFIELLTDTRIINETIQHTT